MTESWRGRLPGSSDGSAWVATTRSWLCVEHTCGECGLFYQQVFREPGTTQAEATAVPRACQGCEEQMPVYRVYGGEFQWQPSLLRMEGRLF